MTINNKIVWFQRLLIYMVFLGLMVFVSPIAVSADGGAVIGTGEGWRYFKGQAEPPSNWTAVNFNDAGWLYGPTGIGYGYEDALTTLDDMRENYASLYMRHIFTVTNVAALTNLTLQMAYDDGFVAYLNGVEVARRNMGTSGIPTPYTAIATGYHEAGKVEAINLSSYLGNLVSGSNVLAIQVHNEAISDDDLAIIPELYTTGDYADVLQLYDASLSSELASDVNFRKMADFYGLKWARVDLKTQTLSDAHLKDSGGAYYRIIGISESALALLDATELALLENAVDVGGANLFIADLSAASSSAVGNLTDGEVTGSQQPADTVVDFIVTGQFPELSREFSGRSWSVTGYDQVDYALTLGASPLHVTRIVSATASNATIYPIFARFNGGSGSVFLQGRNLRYKLGDGSSYWDMDSLYRVNRFSELVPMMMFMQRIAGDESWHRDTDYANLTIDDPNLACDSVPCHAWTLYWNEVLLRMQSHNFHTTIAFIPQYYYASVSAVINVFLNNPDYYSLVFHGNNHFSDAGACPEFAPTIPIAEQEADLIEAKQRMVLHRSNTGIPYGMVMIFPCKLGGVGTVDLLKKHNFNVTINAQAAPLDGTVGTTWDHDMHPAELIYKNFATVQRFEIREENQVYFTSYQYLFDLFRDEPVLLYEHVQDPYNFFASSDAFNAYADTINGVVGDLEWRSLDYIAKRLYLERKNDDGSIAVQMYGNHLILENTSSQTQTYYLSRAENYSYPFQVLVNGQSAPYVAAAQELRLILTIPPAASREILIVYNAAVSVAQSGGVSIVTEGGASDTYTLSLGLPPAANVVVTLTHDAQVIVNPAVVTFTPANWATPQIVAVTAVNDLLFEISPKRSTITHAVSSADPFYNGLPVDSVRVIVFDNDPPASISGVVYEDAANDGVFNAGDTSLPGVLISLSTGVTTTTDLDGGYAFDNLPFGVYTVTETDPIGYGSLGDAQGANDHTIVLSLGVGATVTGQDFRDYRSATMGGRVYEDVDGNGTVGAPDLPLVGVTVIATQGSYVSAMTTDSAGMYEFTGLRPGVYTVTAHDLPGYVSAGDVQGDNDNRVIELVHSGDSVTELNFWDYRPATVGGRVYEDVDGDGVVGGPDLPLVGVMVTATQGLSVLTTTTDDAGHYEFTGLTPGPYTVIAHDLSGYISAGDVQGSNDNTIIGSLFSGDVITGRDFWDYRLATLRGGVYEDGDGDNTVSAVDLPLAGLVITATQGVNILTTVTNGAGEYEFTGLKPGLYTVTAHTLPGYVSTWDARGDNDDMIGGVLHSGNSIMAQNFLDVWVGGEPARAFDLDGVDDVVEIEDVTFLAHFAKGLTLEAWIKVDAEQPSGKPWSGIVTKSFGCQGSGYCLGVSSLVGTAFFEFGVVSGQIYRISSTTFIADNRWHHWAVTYDLAAVKLYIDGNLEGQVTVTDTIAVTTTALRLGSALGDTTTWPFKGELAEVRAWDEALPAAQIQAAMHTPLVGDEAGLVGYWKLDESAGSIAHDRSLHHHHGVLQNMDAVRGMPTAPLEDIKGQQDVKAIWDATPAAHSGGIVLVDRTSAGFLKEQGDHLVFGHNGEKGNTPEDLPAGAEWTGENAQRWRRVWHVSKQDVVKNGGLVDLSFDFGEGGMGAGQGPGLSLGYYRLLKRSDSSGAFVDITLACGATVTVTGDQVVFSGVDSSWLGSYFTLGTVDKIAAPTAVAVRNFTANPIAGWHWAMGGMLFVVGLGCKLRRRLCGLEGDV